MLSINQFDYTLPLSLIAHAPLTKRTASRLLSLDRTSQKLSHHHFNDLATLLQPGDVLVRNETKVIPARLFGQLKTAKNIELLLISPVDDGGTKWKCLTKPGLNQNENILFNSEIEAVNHSPKDSYVKEIEFECSKSELRTFILKNGHTPLPPYISNQSNEYLLRKQYQTTYAKHEGSVAAPTAGLHFTKELDKELSLRDISILPITLHVGLGTFAPLRETVFAEKQLHAEWFSVSDMTAQQINQAKQEKRRIIAVGTTSARTLESCTNSMGRIEPKTSETTLFIFPPYKFRSVDGLITNFHLPKSSLLTLVSAFVSAPNTPENFTSFNESLIGKSYQKAISEQYRFYSFGDAMLIT